MKKKISKKALKKGVLIGIVFLLCYSLPFLHFEYEKLSEWEPYKQHYKTYDKIINSYNSDRAELIANFEQNFLGKDDFLRKIKEIELSKKNKLSFYHLKKRELKREYSFLGYSSFRYFLYAIGFPILSLFLSILLLIFIFKSKHINDFKAFYLVSISGFIFVSSFWVFHSLLTRTDFSKAMYKFSYVLIAGISTLIVYLLIYLYNKVDINRRIREEESGKFIQSTREMLKALKESI
ncbi:conserved membrane hypothetical protein [Tenacibaculum maritimum]|uniref:hypothetical protein n=1 Tax=Tenacibaculum maritimum TaxID=107401 RepID=UPI0012E53BAC|nr:hypothetical protein [Tenacibaculum maritimum]MDB0602725.1 hypothetical protein [Tenacibaculum maritimum]MDB0612327.1 hypothetical protein [Tenacibaculum maritimum]CAA0144311.1 conserved membrane hypothetical protein [Tenacibaculum maritimum]CAA0196055.1 conserved membrane hypothetical protein [Tenacibaculum maritimum]